MFFNTLKWLHIYFTEAAATVPQKTNLCSFFFFISFILPSFDHKFVGSDCINSFIHTLTCAASISVNTVLLYVMSLTHYNVNKPHTKSRPLPYCMCAGDRLQQTPFMFGCDQILVSNYLIMQMHSHCKCLYPFLFSP